MSECGGADALDNGGTGASGPGASSSFVESTPLVVAVAALTPVVQWTIPPGMLSRDGDALDIRIGGTLLQSNAVAQTYFIGISLGGLPIWGATSAAYALSANRRAHLHRFVLMRTGALTCTLIGDAEENNSALLPVVGVGGTTTAPQGGPLASTDADPACDWSIAQALEIAVQPSAATATWTRKAALGILLRAP